MEILNEQDALIAKIATLTPMQRMQTYEIAGVLMDLAKRDQVSRIDLEDVPDLTRSDRDLPTELRAGDQTPNTNSNEAICEVKAYPQSILCYSHPAFSREYYENQKSFLIKNGVKTQVATMGVKELNDYLKPTFRGKTPPGCERQRTEGKNLSFALTIHVPDLFLQSCTTNSWWITTKRDRAFADLVTGVLSAQVGQLR